MMIDGLTTDGKYLEAETYIATLEDALAKHVLDRSGILEELAQAVAHCTLRIPEHAEKTRRWTVARALYLAKVKEMTLHDRDIGGFQGWCNRHKVGLSQAYELARIGTAIDPAQALIDFRIYNRRKTYDSIEHRTGRRPGSFKLGRMKAAWYRLNSEEQEEFLDWVTGNTRLGKSRVA
jgi:hypothetical protein